MRGPATTIMRNAGARSLAAGKAAITRRRRSAPTPDPPTVTMQTRWSSSYPSWAQVGPTPQVNGVKAGHVAGEGEMTLGPVTNHRQPGPEPFRDDVLGIADEQSEVADLGVVSDVVDHVRVVVGGLKPLTLAPVGHRQKADKVGQPHERH